MNEEIIPKKTLFATLPKERTEDVRSAIVAASSAKTDAIIVLDDDPTGTQTVYDTPVLTEWSVEAIRNELALGSPLFYILTNSRSLVPSAAKELAEEIADNILKTCAELNKKCLIISRSDSTLRGHYPVEVDALFNRLKIENAVTFIIPAFFEGGRYTINDIHYVHDGDELIPAAQTPFAEDKVFGYTRSNMKEWVEEKTEGKIQAEHVQSISLDDIRLDTKEALREKINTFKGGDVCIVNAASYADLDLASLAILTSEITPIFRTAASFVASVSPNPRKGLLPVEAFYNPSGHGGLMVVGSYVPMTTTQLIHLEEHTDIVSLEIDVAALLQDAFISPKELATQVGDFLQSGKNVMVFTSRQLISASSSDDNLKIGKTISDYLVQFVAALQVVPKYVMGKGGITSNVIASDGLGARRGMVMGQLIAGVPVWQLGPESKFPGVPYIVFPGNVGGKQGLTEAYKRLNAS